MKNLALIFWVGIVLFSCKKEEEPAPTATGSYTGTFSGYVSPESVSGACRANFVETNGKLTGTIYTGSTGEYPFTGAITDNRISGEITLRQFGSSPFPCGGTITVDRKTIELSINPAPVLNLKWVLTKD